MHASFTVIEPLGVESALVVEIPHAGLFVDGPALARLDAPARSLGRDADLYVDDLYTDAATVGATLLVSHVSRYVCDLNRSERDLDAETIEGAPPHARATRGIIWRLTSDGHRVLASPLPAAEFERRLATYYRPYHQSLAALLERKRARFGFAVLLAAHSMPSVDRSASGDGQHARADVVPGTRGRTSASGTFIDCVDSHARRSGFSVKHDDPYQGGYTTQHYGRPDLNVHVVQVELARRLYMHEPTLSKTADFDLLRAWCTALAESLSTAKP